MRVSGCQGVQLELGEGDGARGQERAIVDAVGLERHIYAVGGQGKTKNEEKRKRRTKNEGKKKKAKALSTDPGLGGKNGAGDGDRRVDLGGDVHRVDVPGVSAHLGHVACPPAHTPRLATTRTSCRVRPAYRK